MRPRISALVLAAGVVLAACGSDEPSGSPVAGAEPTTDDLLSFEASTVDASTLDVGSLAGTDVAIWFWAPW